MTDVQITLTLPEDLAERTRVTGLLNSERLSGWLEQELERLKLVDQLFEDIQKLHALEPKLSQEEIDAEIEVGCQAYYEKQHRK